MTEVESTIRRYIVQRIMKKDDESLIQVDEPILQKGIIDSMEFIKLVAFLEDEFGITIDDEDVAMENFQSIQSMSQLVARTGKGA